MKKCKVGIDFSMNSAAVCVERDNEIHFFVFPRSTTKNMDALLKEKNVHVHVVPKEKPANYNDDIAHRERFNTKDSVIIANEMTEVLSQFLMGYEVSIGIEGIAFMSRGNSIAQFSGYHYILRAALTMIADLENIFVFQPTTVKKLAGGGRFKKPEMIKAFMESNDPLLSSTVFHTALNENVEQFQSVRAKNFLKPVDDMVDSYWVLRCLDIEEVVK